MNIPTHLLSAKTPLRYHVRRQRLLDIFDQAAFARVLLLDAPAGYGKTSAVIDLIQQIGQPVAWYPLEFLDHPTTFDFLWNLVRSIQQGVPIFGKSLDQLAPEPTALDVNNVLLPTIVNEFGLLTEPLIVVLDNYHHISSQEINESLIHLIERSPNTVRFVVTSRSTPHWPVRWTTEAQLAVFTETELAFTQEECIDLAGTIGVQLTRNELGKIFSHIGGWPILYTLLYTSIQSSPSAEVMSVLHNLSMPNSMIYQYLAGEILNKELPWMQDALRKTSVLQQIDGAMCEMLLNMQHGDVVLGQLATSVFLSPFNSGRKRYYIHSHEIMRTFLLDELRRVYGQVEVDRLYKRVAEIMEAQGSLDQAISYYCQAQCFDEAARIMKEHGSRLVSSIDFQRLQTWLAQIPKHVLGRDPHLLVYQGIVLMNTDRELADIPLHQARTLFIAQNDTVNRIRTEGELAWLLLLQGKFAEGLTYLTPALEEATLPVEIKARLMHIMAMMIYGKDQFTPSLVYTEQAAQLYRTTRTIEGKMALARLLRHLSAIYFMQGRLRDALRVMEEARDLAAALKLGNLSLAWINNQIATVYQQLARFEEALLCLDEAERVLELYPIQSTLHKFITINKGHIYRETYNYERAEEYYRRAGRVPSDGVFMALRLVQYGQASKALPQALKGWQKSRNFESPVDTAKYDVVLGIVYLSINDYEKAQHFLEQGNALLMKHEAWFYATTAWMYLAKLYLHTGKVSRAHIYLNDTLLQMKTNSYYGLDVWQPWMIAELCAYAIEQDIEAAFAEELVIKRIDKVFVSPFLKLLTHVDSRVRNQASRVLELTGDTIRLHAYQLLDEYNEKAGRERIRGYLQNHWLLASGLIRLKSFLTWREIDIFLLWISPNFRGSREKIAEETHLVPGTVNDHVKKICIKLEKFLSEDLGGKGTHALAFEWAISEEIIYPYKLSLFEYDN